MSEKGGRKHTCTFFRGNSFICKISKYYTDLRSLVDIKGPTQQVKGSLPFW